MRLLPPLLALVAALCVLGCEHPIRDKIEGPQVTAAPAASPCGRLQIPRGDLCVAALPEKRVEQQVRFRSGETPGGRIWLRGTLSLPVWEGSGHGPVPGVVLVHGSGPMSREGWMVEDVKGPFKEPVAVLRDLAGALSARGYAVLRYDKRTCTVLSDEGCDYAAEVARGATWGDLVGDVEAAATFLGAQPGVAAEDIILVGYSQGATLALQVRAEAAVARDLVLLSGTYAPIDEVIVRQASWQINDRAERLPTDALAEAFEQLSTLKAALREIRSGFWGESEVFMNARASFWRDWMVATGRTGDMLEAHQGPLLYVAGGDDQNVNEEDHAAFLGAFKGRSDAEVALLSGLSHALHRREGPGQVHNMATDVILRWLGRPPE